MPRKTEFAKTDSFSKRNVLCRIVCCTALCVLLLHQEDNESTAMRFAGKEPFPNFFVESNKEGEKWQLASQSQLKKVKKIWQREQYKNAEKVQKEKEDADRREKNLEDAKKIIITIDDSLPKPVEVKIRDCVKHRGQRVKVYGWVHRLRRQGKALMFITLRDGSGFLQCVLNDLLCQTYEALVLSTESSICVYGIINEVPEGKSAPGGHELQCDYWQLIGDAPSGGIENVLNELGRTLAVSREYQEEEEEDMATCKSIPMVLLNLKSQLTATKAEGPISWHMAFKNFMIKVLISQKFLSPCVASNIDSDSIVCKVFFVKYFLNECLSSNIFNRYTHVEAECPFITFNDLLDRLEDLICDVVERILKSPVGYLVHEFNPDFKPPKKPFRRMNYADAIVYLRENNITKEDGSFYEFGEDIPEMPERKMTDKINEPIMLCRFPAEIKSFYMSKCPEDPRLTESVDVLMPGVGEIIGGSMRLWKYEEIMEGYKIAGIDPKNYYWYTDQRKYGSCPHGGFGLGLERFLTWLLNRYHIRDTCLYPRFVDRCTP
ncbi:UNVERIFIED_CONTAM: Asparagine--tRNA ligase [Trichonephila clavipes]